MFYITKPEPESYQIWPASICWQKSLYTFVVDQYLKNNLGSIVFINKNDSRKKTSDQKCCKTENMVLMALLTTRAEKMRKISLCWLSLFPFLLPLILPFLLPSSSSLSSSPSSSPLPPPFHPSPPPPLFLLPSSSFPSLIINSSFFHCIKNQRKYQIQSTLVD